MSNLEHLVENGLVALENGCSHEDWIKEIENDLNWNDCLRLTIDDLWEICQYVYFDWIADLKVEDIKDIYSIG